MRVYLYSVPLSQTSSPRQPTILLLAPSAARSKIKKLKGWQLCALLLPFSAYPPILFMLTIIFIFVCSRHNLKKNRLESSAHFSSNLILFSLVFLLFNLLPQAFSGKFYFIFAIRQRHSSSISFFDLPVKRTQMCPLPKGNSSWQSGAFLFCHRLSKKTSLKAAVLYKLSPSIPLTFFLHSG